jgi:NTP pyrophosphatase (non-canonical NTP hydrolase)
MSDILTTNGSGNQVHCYRDDHEPWREILDARRKAHEKHGDNSIEGLASQDPSWLTILVEEVGEVAQQLTYDHDRSGLRSELVDVLAVASAWLASLDLSEGNAT